MLKQQKPNGLRRLKRRLLRPFRKPYVGAVDGLDDTLIYGWVQHRSADRDGMSMAPLKVGLFTQTGMLLSTDASVRRPDVVAAGYSRAQCGFSFELTPALRRAIAEQGGEVSVRVLNDAAYLVGRWRLPEEMMAEEAPALAASDLSLTWQEQCRTALGEDLARLEHLLEVSGESAGKAPEKGGEAPGLHDKLFTPVAPASQHVPALPAYLDFTRYRCREDRNFAPLDNDEEFAHYLNWYLDHYSTNRGGLRVPLSREIIDYLNEDMVIGGQRNVASRIMWWRLSRNMTALAGLNLSERGSYWELCYWWAWNEAHALHVEDCLVGPRVIDALREVTEKRAGDAWPLTPFLDRFVRDNQRFHFVHGEDEQERRLLSLSMLVIAAARPDLLRYLPESSIEAAFTPDIHDTTPFGSFLAELTGNPDYTGLTRARYGAALRQVGFDLDSGTFLTRDGAGNRYEAAALVAREDMPEVDVQLIGPLEKASGLGQATRLSAKALDLTGLRVNKVDFGLDNPSPEGFSSVQVHGGHARARINLIHLNAESVPLALAYEPDVFNGAYNIGYFFWELDSPAACHYLALELLDEVWVSSQYGVDIYRPATDRPVTRVGMCYEPVPDIDREEARAFVAQCCETEADCFTFLVVFDSFSFIQRKNPVGVLRAFQKAFGRDEDVRLIVKTQNRDRVGDPRQVEIWNEVDEIVASDERIVVVNRTLSYGDLLKLKKGSDCYVSLHKSEGWGFGMIEAMNLMVPVICTGYSGNMEFCSPETAWLVGYREVELEPDDYIFVVEGQKWAEPDIRDAARQMRAVRDNPEARAQKAETARKHVQRRFSPEVIAGQYEARLREILRELPGPDRGAQGGQRGRR